MSHIDGALMKMEKWKMKKKAEKISSPRRNES
jgi:hypothetical protein